MYNPDFDLRDNKNPLDWLIYYQYVVYLVTVATPFYFFCLAGVTFHLIWNVDANEWWAKGNWWLIWSSLQLFASMPLALMIAIELPVFMNNFFITRIMWFCWAIIYLITYFSGALENMTLLYIIDDTTKEDLDFFTVFLSMLLAYNTLMNWPQMGIYLFWIWKELSLIFY